MCEYVATSIQNAGDHSRSNYRKHKVNKMKVNHFNVIYKGNVR